MAGDVAQFGSVHRRIRASSVYVRARIASWPNFGPTTHTSPRVVDSEQRAKVSDLPGHTHRRAQEDSEEVDRHKSEADGWRHMLMKVTGDLGAANDEISREREKASKLVAEHERSNEELRQQHADELLRMEQRHAQALRDRDDEVDRVWQETQLARGERDRSQAEFDGLLEEERRARAEEVARIRWEHAEAMSQKDSELERLQQEAQLERDEARFQRSEADETWRQRCAEAEGQLRLARGELAQEREQLQKARAEHAAALARLKKGNVEEMARVAQDHQQAFVLKDAEVERLRKEVQFERRESERKKAEVEADWQKRLDEVEAKLQVARADFQQERERMVRAQGEVERTLDDARHAHAEQVTRLLTKHTAEISQKDAEVEKARRELQHEREEGERLCSTIDDAWRTRLADSEKDLTLLSSELREAQRLAAKQRAESAAAMLELRESASGEVKRLTRDHALAMDRCEAELDSERRAAQRALDRLEQERAEMEEQLRARLQELDVDLRTAKDLAAEEREAAERLQAESKRALQSLEEAQAAELARRASVHSKALQKRDVDLEQLRNEARRERQAAESHESESQEAWRWLSRLEGDLKLAQRELKQERELSAKLGRTVVCVCVWGPR